MTDELQALIAELAADGDLSPDDLARIHDAARAAHADVKAEQDWRSTAHVHDVAHAPIVSFDADELKAYLADGGDPDKAGDFLGELVDASGVICHDCQRELVSDKGDRRLLVCSRLHGRRPGELVPEHPDGAVECGRP